MYNGISQLDIVVRREFSKVVYHDFNALRFSAAFDVEHKCFADVVIDERFALSKVCDPLAIDAQKNIPEF